MHENGAITIKIIKTYKQRGGGKTDDVSSMTSCVNKGIKNHLSLAPEPCIHPGFLSAALDSSISFIFSTFSSPLLLSVSLLIDSLSQLTGLQHSVMLSLCDRPPCQARHETINIDGKIGFAQTKKTKGFISSEFFCCCEIIGYFCWVQVYFECSHAAFYFSISHVYSHACSSAYYM